MLGWSRCLTALERRQSPFIYLQDILEFQNPGRNIAGQKQKKNDNLENHNTRYNCFLGYGHLSRGLNTTCFCIKFPSWSAGRNSTLLKDRRKDVWPNECMLVGLSRLQTKVTNDHGTKYVDAWVMWSALHSTGKYNKYLMCASMMLLRYVWIKLLRCVGNHYSYSKGYGLAPWQSVPIQRGTRNMKDRKM